MRKAAVHVQTFVQFKCPALTELNKLAERFDLSEKARSDLMADDTPNHCSTSALALGRGLP